MEEDEVKALQKKIKDYTAMSMMKIGMQTGGSSGDDAVCFPEFPK
eukprot:SAG22_NODE_221_length_14781_cov_82.531490_9_plen_45_part_00